MCKASGTWVWNSNSAFGPTTVGSGTLAVDNLLFSPVSVNSGGVLAGHGTISGAVSNGGTVAPGAAVPFSTLTVQGNVSFRPARSSGSTPRPRDRTTSSPCRRRNIDRRHRQCAGAEPLRLVRPRTRY